ncbi:MAG: HAMP domain-containing protein [Myxococcales bacterium]|nr:HAMP domain-containing protein [Myxococcales bacterium]
MKLRHRLFLFSTSQLVVFGVLFALAFWSFERSVLPVLEGLLRDKTEGVARVLSADLDVPLAAEDPKLMADSLARIEADPDFSYVVVRDVHGALFAARGTAPPTDVFSGPANTAVVGAEGISTWAPVSLEGVNLGTVAVVFSTDRFASLDRWARRLGVGVTLLWLVALGYSIVFARSFVSPIRAMMDFSRKVAGGALHDRLVISPPGELRDLRDYLNQMTAELERRELAREQDAARTEDMQRELLSVSRMAGMAEIATGVLHNVGNVLNSLNVSVSVIGERVRSSRTAALSKSVELFDGFPGGLPAFLETDKGRILPGYLSSVSKRLAEDNASVLTELASVTRNVDHIKSIVAMQQSYARPSELDDAINLAGLVDDALRMGESSFAKHGIEIVKDYEDGAIVVSDRHKVLQILINLISNSRHALKEVADGRPRLTVRIRKTSGGASVAITDTGIGIPAENLEKIFRHGFTTKPSGHGFGLHASANAARELGGRLAVASDGAGAGATFTLELPAQPRRGDVVQN